MSHALLLRLFLAPSFFSVHVALQYLKHYSDNIGITYYLTRRLNELDTRELRDVWGFICHLLVTRPSRSRALECFVVDIAHRSTHIAMLTLWFMQASLKDLAQNPGSPSFHICQRVLHECHEIIFGDLPASSATPYSTLHVPFLSRFSRRKIKPHVSPVMVGMGMILAGVPGLPKLTGVIGQVAVEQGRVSDEASDVRSLESVVPETVPPVPPSSHPIVEDDDEEDEEPFEEHQDTDWVPPDTRVAGPSFTKPTRRKTVGPSQTSPALLARKARLSFDPFGQFESQQPLSTTNPFQSTPSILSSRQHRTSNLSEADVLLQQYDIESQMHLLRGHFCRSEVQFLLTVENISNRLLVVPKPARVSALRAELTALNHMLPAEVCIPLWCSSSDKPQADGVPEPHHRIVRIPPSESVVLNSAERAPYLLVLEILHSDLDFNATKRSNKDILRKIVVKESERKGASRDIVTFDFTPVASDTDHNRSKSLPLEDVNGVDAALGATSMEPANRQQPTVAQTNTPTPPIPTSGLSGENWNEEEEMDLVEQLYGADESFLARTIDLSESIVLPAVPKNRDLDLVTWSKSGPPSPFLTTDPGQQTAGRTPSPSTPLANDSPSPAGGNSLSLDDYSERMRTAAVMLAQLNANMIPLVSSGHANQDASSSTGSLSWLPGSSWLGSTPSAAPSSTEQPDPTQRSASHQNVEQQHPGTSSSRLRLQYSEATAIRNRIMQEMLALEEERMERMRENREYGGQAFMRLSNSEGGSLNSVEDENIIRKELNKVDPSAVVFSESWATKKSRIRQGSPYGHLANWDCVAVIVKTGGDLRQEQLAVQLIQEFERIWKEENCQCWVRYFQILITGGSSGLVETITDAVSIHSIKKAEYARRLTQGRLGHVTLLDHFITTYGDPSSAKFARAQRNFAKSLAGYSLVTYLLQIKDRHNGNILLDRGGHLVHIDFGFMLSNSPGNIGFEAAPFKLPFEYVDVLGGVESESFGEFKRLFMEGFEAARKHCDRIVTMVELMQKDSTLPCFAALGEQTANQLRDRFQQGLTHSLVREHVEKLIETSLGSSWTRLYDSYQYYSQSIL